MKTLFEKFKNSKLNSRKLAVTLAAGIIVTVATHLGWPEAQVSHYVEIAAAYVLGQGAVDVAKVIKTPKEAQ